MPNGERRARARHVTRGFTYLALLLWLAIGGVAMAAWGTQWSVAAEREREREMIFRGGQIRAAVAAYWAAQEPHELPPTPESLLVDRRGNIPRHHLRRLYADPFADRAAGLPGADVAAAGGWQWIADPAPGRLTGVASQRHELRYLHPGSSRFVFAPAPPEAGDRRNEESAQ